MAKSRKQKFKPSAHTPYHRPSKAHDHAVKHAAKNQKSGPLRQHQIPTIPFEPIHRILLVGEGDFSFAHSLYTSHHCENLTATCLDSATTLAEKYPQSTRHIQELENATSKDETAKAKILFGVDATKLGKGGLGSGGKEVKKGDFDRIVFNFPHVGGLTKDVNRQVRHNQGIAGLLVNFFKAALPLLASNGSIILTIFESEPYSLWNVRDLARHVHLKVGRSFKFQAEAYPGYKHARTLGNIEGGGGWKGETRAARTYVFEKQDGEGRQEQETSRKGKSSGSSDSDEDD
ncbi:MAG: hypothetical protein Q9215_001823 [Flavoplaca cf. flavocitrina]